MKSFKTLPVALAFTLSACGIKGERNAEVETGNAESMKTELKKIAELQSGSERLELYTGDESLWGSSNRSGGVAHLVLEDTNHSVESDLVRISVSERNHPEAFQVYQENLMSGEVPYRVSVSPEAARMIAKKVERKPEKKLEYHHFVFCFEYLIKPGYNVGRGMERLSCYYANKTCYTNESVAIPPSAITQKRLDEAYECNHTSPEHDEAIVADQTRVIAIELKINVLGGAPRTVRFELKN